MTVVLTSLMITGIAYASDQVIARGEEAKLPDGVVGVSLHIGADRVGDPALLYIGRVHPEGPAAKAGLRNGDELVTVDGTAVAGKSYEQVVKMVRGEAGTNVKLGVKRENDGGVREVSLTRIASEKFSKGPPEHGTYKDKP
jgi:C-terminal processing protease CtpA/Prc